MFEVREKGKNEVEIVTEDDYTVPALLQEELVKDEDVEFVAYKKTHPLEKTMVFYLRTKKGDPRKKIVEAIKRIKKRLEEFEREMGL